jgi:hypothetical protein
MKYCSADHFWRSGDLYEIITGISRAFQNLSCLRAAYAQMLQNSIGHYEKEDVCSSKLMALIRHDEALPAG